MSGAADLMSTARPSMAVLKPELIKKGVKPGIDGYGSDKIIGLYAAGLSNHQRHPRPFEEVLRAERGLADLVSRAQMAVLAEVSETWQNRALEPMYSIVFPLIALRVKIRDCGKPSGSRKQSRTVALGSLLEAR